MNQCLMLGKHQFDEHTSQSIIHQDQCSVFVTSEKVANILHSGHLYITYNYNILYDMKYRQLILQSL